MNTVLYIVVPCFNEREVLPVTSGLFLKELEDLISKGKISDDSRILFVNDGSQDGTWDFIKKLAAENLHFMGITQSRNRGHQNSVLAGLMEAMQFADITITIDCDGQDDIAVMEQMVDEYYKGSEIVYGVRKNRETDTFFKRTSAQHFYKFLSFIGVETVYNHADYRLISSRVLRELSNFQEVNLYLRGMISLLGFQSSSVYYERHERLAGKSHYPLVKMISLAFEGVTSLSAAPLHLIMCLGAFISFLSFVGIIWAVFAQMTGQTVAGWASITCIMCFLGGIQLISIGILGEYLGKIYMETKHRPRYIISERTWLKEEETSKSSPPNL